MFNGTTTAGQRQQHYYYRYNEDDNGIISQSREISKANGMPLRFHIANYYETYSENEDLQKGDIIKKIDEYDVRDLRHVDAQKLLKNSDCVKLGIERIRNTIGMVPPALPKSPIPPHPCQSESPDSCSRRNSNFNNSYDEAREEKYILSQPYRTTPLVLPGAKVKKDAPLGECYLRHHPNPMVRAPPHHFDPVNPEVAMKQKVAESVLQRVLSPNDLPKVVHKQFNSPIGLYSEQNIQDTLKCQASAIPKKPGKFDPSQSETYKALIEEGYEGGHGGGVQHISQPTRQGVFAPQKANWQPTARPAPYRPRSPAVNVTDSDGETIHQSNSFRRIMFSVLGETEY